MGKKARLKKEKMTEGRGEEPLLSSKITKYFHSNIVFSILISLILVLGVTLRIQNFGNVGRRSPDENVYTSQAAIIVQSGVESIEAMVREHGLDKRRWIFPPPSRVGYLLPLAAIMKAANKTDVEMGARFSTFFSIVALILLIIVGMRFFNRWVTLYALLFLSVSPMDLMIARRTWQDAMIASMGLFLICITCEITRNTSKIKAYIPFILVGSYMVLIKESGGFIFALCTAWLLWLLIIKEKSLIKGISLAAASALGAAVSISIMAYLTGGFSNLIEIMAHIKEGMPTNTYAVEYQMGPWHHFLGSFWIVSPVSATLCMIGLLMAPLTDIKERYTLYGMIFFATALFAITAILPYLQNLRYLSAAYGPFYLIGGMGLWRIMVFMKARLKDTLFSAVTVCVLVGLIVGASLEYRNFQKKFVRTGIVDMSVKLLRESPR